VFFALDSFGRYVNEHKNADTRIFAVVANGQHQIVAILDFHGSAPAWGNHTARFTPEFSRQWRLWSEINGNPMLQSAFINFIERNIVDVKNPTAAAMLELLEYVEAKQDARFENKLAVTDGKTKVLFEEDLTVATGRTTKTGMFELPRSLTTSFPVLKGAAAEELPWRLRPSVQNRQLMFTLDLPHAAQLVDQRHFDLLAQVKELTGIEPFAGAFAKG
jgi:hypothetical protein